MDRGNSTFSASASRCLLNLSSTLLQLPKPWVSNAASDVFPCLNITREATSSHHLQNAFPACGPEPLLRYNHGNYHS